MSNSEWWDNKTVLVTGAEGFIGKELVSYLKHLGSKVYTQQKDGMIVPFEMSPDVDVVFHLAAKTVVTEDGSADMISNNLNSTLSILEFGRRYGVRSTVIVSSDRVYGEDGRIGKPFTEDDPLLARDVYGTSKILGDVLAQSYIERGYPVGIARCSNVYGPGDRHLNRIIPSIMDSIISDKRPVLKNGSPERDYIYVDDAVSGLLLVAQHTYDHKKGHKVFNLSSGRCIRNDKLLDKIIGICDNDILADVSQTDSLRVSRQCADPSRAELVLGWKRSFDLDGGLRKTIAWWRSKNV